MKVKTDAMRRKSAGFIVIWLRVGLLGSVWLLGFLRGSGVEHQNVAPGARSIEDGAQLLIALAMALQLAVLQLDKGRSRSLGRKSDFDFTGLGRIRVGLPIRLIVAGANMPREGDAMRRV